MQPKTKKKQKKDHIQKRLPGSRWDISAVIWARELIFWLRPSFWHAVMTTKSRDQGTPNKEVL